MFSLDFREAGHPIDDLHKRDKAEIGGSDDALVLLAELLLNIGLPACDIKSDEGSMPADKSYVLECSLALFPVQTQEPTNNAITIDETTRTEVAEKFAQVFADDYCHADLGAKVAAAIRARVKAKAYDAITSPSDFADALERDARGVINDRHISVWVDFNSEPTMGSDSPSIENASPEIRILDGNIGYMVVNGMPANRDAWDAIGAAFAFLHNSDALILDLRGNVGGSGAADMWYMSFLSEGPARLLETVHRRKGPLFESKTIDVGDRSYGAKKPVFVLTSHRTFSAGEALAYDIQAFKRGLAGCGKRRKFCNEEAQSTSNCA